MAGNADLWETIWGAGSGYAYDDYGGAMLGDEHTHFLVWLIVFLLAATAILGGLKVSGFHFVVKV